MECRTNLEITVFLHLTCHFPGNRVLTNFRWWATHENREGKDQQGSSIPDLGYLLWFYTEWMSRTTNFFICPLCSEDHLQYWSYNLFLWESPELLNTGLTGNKNVNKKSDVPRKGKGESSILVTGVVKLRVRHAELRERMFLFLLLFVKAKDPLEWKEKGLQQNPKNRNVKIRNLKYYP